MREFRPTLTRGERREERRRWAVTTTASVVLHVLLIALVLRIEPPPPRPGPAGGWLFAELVEDPGGGGGEPQAVALGLPASSAPNLDPPLLPVPEIDVDIPELSLETPATDEVVVMAPPTLAPPTGGQSRAPTTGSGGGSGGGAGPGTGQGAGPGAGGAAGGDGVRPPAPLTILVPPAATAAVRGRGAKVRLQVDSAGVVRGADVVVSSGDRRYDEQLRRVALGWRFRPARDAANRPVPYPFEVSVTF